MATSNTDVFCRGLHYDNVTGQHFELYTVDQTLSEEAVFESYWSAFNERGTSLAKRDWYDCRFPRQNYIQKFGCNTGHGLGAFLSNTGAAATGGYISSLLQEAFNGSRDNKKPRSVCLSRDGKNLCISWASYDTDHTTAAENTDITNFSVECAKSGGSAEFKTTTGGNGVLFICVSNRADGCGKNVC
jgi:hypothetical protein